MKTELQAKESHVTGPDIMYVQVTVTRPGYHACGVPVENYTGNEVRQVGRRSRKEHLPPKCPQIPLHLG